MSELFLSRLQLDPRRREVQRALADCHMLHQQILTGFATAKTPNAREEFGILYRLEIEQKTGVPALMVQSTTTPDWARSDGPGLLAAGETAEIKEISAAHEAIAPGMRLRFRLRANPTRRVNRSHAGTDPMAGKRVDVRDEKGQRDWLDRQAERCGFSVVGVQVQPGDVLGGKQRGRRGKGDDARRLTFTTVIFDGVLEVANVEVFRAALRQGIGSAKAYGFGLLSVAPARE